jgi:hypothetical protein
MKYYTYKITFKDLPGYFYYGSHKDSGKPYFGSPVTWAHLWVLFEAEVQILQWYKTEREVKAAEDSIIQATWKERHSLNENVGGRISEKVCRENGRKTGKKTARVMNTHPNTRASQTENGGKSGSKNAKIMNAHPNTRANRQRMAKKNAEVMNAHPNTLESQRRNAKAHNEKTSKRIVQLDSDVVYVSMAEASRKTGVPVSNIRKCCRGDRKTAGGYRWAFEG